MAGCDRVENLGLSHADLPDLEFWPEFDADLMESQWLAGAALEPAQAREQGTHPGPRSQPGLGSALLFTEDAVDVSGVTRVEEQMAQQQQLSAQLHSLVPPKPYGDARVRRAFCCA
jgi:hypothetical protein